MFTALKSRCTACHGTRYRSLDLAAWPLCRWCHSRAEQREDQMIAEPRTGGNIRNIDEDDGVVLWFRSDEEKWDTIVEVEVGEQRPLNFYINDVYMEIVGGLWRSPDLSWLVA